MPQRNFETLGMGRIESEVNLYCRKVLIQAKAKGLFPGVAALPQGRGGQRGSAAEHLARDDAGHSLMQKLNKVLTGRFLKFLDEQAEKDAAAYEKFYAEYQRFLKEGVATDFTHKEALGKLLRYESSTTEKGKLTSLADYVKRMPAEQKEIYYLLAPNREAAESSPYFEVFQERKFEVLFLYDPWDEFVMEHLHEFRRQAAARRREGRTGAGGRRTPGRGAVGRGRRSPGQVAQGNAGRQGWARCASPSGWWTARRWWWTRQVHDLEHAADPEGHAEGRRGRAGEAGPGDQSAPPDHGRAWPRMRQTDDALAAKVAEQVLDNARVAAGLLEDPRAMLDAAQSNCSSGCSLRRSNGSERAQGSTAVWGINPRCPNAAGDYRPALVRASGGSRFITDLITPGRLTRLTCARMPPPLNAWSSSA